MQEAGFGDGPVDATFKTLKKSPERNRNSFNLPSTHHQWTEAQGE